MVPILIRSSETLTDSTDILKRVDELSPARIRLYPDDPELRRQVEQLEDRYDNDLGPAVRRVVYFQLLDHRTAYPILAGDRFTAADLSFAAQAAPLLFPPEYGRPLPPLETMPGGYREEIAGCRSTPAGAFVLRLYAEERGAP